MKTSCPHCGQHYDVDDSDLGKEADCTSCGKRFIIQSSAETVSNLKVRSNKGVLVGVWAIFFLLLIFGVVWGIWQINAANAEKERQAEEDRIQLEIIHEQKIAKCVTFLRELALDCACHRDIKKHPTFPALQKSAREAVSYLETFPEDFDKYLKDRNESNMLAWWKEKIFGDEK